MDCATAPPARLDLTAIEASLRVVQRNFPQINQFLKTRRDSMDDAVVENMMTGYVYVDEMIARGIDAFAMGQVRHLLELNARVLCGTTRSARDENARHLKQSEDCFYDDARGGIGDIVEWYKQHSDDSVWKRAAGVYVRILSEPQLFIEGNHRTGALVMSYILAREGEAPFVLTVDNAKAYFDPSTMITKIKKGGFARLYRLPKIKSNFAEFLKAQASSGYLLKPVTAGNG